MIRILITMIFWNCFAPQINAQCEKDYFGWWQTTKGKYIKFIENKSELLESAKVEIGTKEVNYSGFYHFSRYHSKMVTQKKINPDSTIQTTLVERKFRYQIIKKEKETMKIRPISADMKSIFGGEDFLTYKMDIVTLDEFVFDSLYCKLRRPRHELRIDNYGVMTLRRVFYRHRKIICHDVARLSSEQFAKLKFMVFRSKIATMSKCELTDDDYSSFSDSFPLKMKIFHNEKEIIYSRHSPHSTVIPLNNYLKNLTQKLKWKKIKKRKSRLCLLFSRKS